MSELIELFQNTTLNTSTIDHYTYNAIRDLDLVYPRYNKIMLSEVSNTFHEQALDFKSKIIKGYRFKDEDEAGSIPEFLENNLVDLFDNPVSFQEMLEYLDYFEAMYFSSLLSLNFIGEKAEKMRVLSPKYTYFNKDKSELWQIKPDADFAKFLQQPGTIENNIDYREVSVKFTRLADSNLKGSGIDERFFEFSGKGSMSAFYSNVPYLDSLKDMESNKFIGNYDKNWLKNATSLNSILELIGINPKQANKQGTPEYKIKRDYEYMLNNPTNNGKTFVFANPFPDKGIAFHSQPTSNKEDFGETRDRNRDSILASHGLNPTLLGIKTNESSLTSTAVGEAINLYRKTQLDNKIMTKQRRFNALFKTIDPTYKTEIIFDYLSFEDEEQTVKIEAQEISNEDKLIARGSLEELNDYRKKRDKRIIKDDEWQEMRTNYINSGLNFEETPLD